MLDLIVSLESDVVAVLAVETSVVCLCSLELGVGKVGGASSTGEGVGIVGGATCTGEGVSKVGLFLAKVG